MNITIPSYDSLLPDRNKIKAINALYNAFKKLISGGISKENLAEDVQEAIDKAENAVSTPEGAGSPGQVLQLDSEGVPSWTTPSAGTVPDAELSESSTNAVQNKVITKELNDNYAKKDGFYESMGVGTAVNLAGQVERTNDSLYRTSGGTEDIATGTARIEGIKGQTIAWNVLIKNGNFESISNWAAGTQAKSFGVSDNCAFFYGNIEDTGYGVRIQQSFNSIQGRKYFVCFGIKLETEDYNEANALCAFFTNSSAFAGNENFNIETNKWNYHSVILSAKGGNLFAIGLARLDAPKGYDKKISVKNVVLIDLTLIYGAGNEPSTPEQFEADYQRWFGKPLTYEPYDEGSLRNVMLDGLKTIGFNLLNLNREAKSVAWTHYDAHPFKESEYYIGYATSDYFIPSKINNYSVNNSSVIVNPNQLGYGIGFPIKCLPSTSYYFNSSFSDKVFFAAFYDANGRYISNSQSPQIITTPANCYWIVVCFRGAENVDNVFNNPIVNLSWSGIKNGTYEPYEENTISIPTTTMTGKLNGEGESVVIFSDGMKGVNDVHDEIYYVGGKTYAVKRIGRESFDNFTLWSKNNHGYTAKLIGKAKNNTNNAICGRYIHGNYSTESMQFTLVSSGNQTFIGIGDLTYPDVSSFIAAMNGVYLDYELAEPLVYEVDDFTLPARYKVNDWGTEEQLQASGANGIAAIISCLYGVNAVDRLRRLNSTHMSIESMDNFLAALGAAMGGTWAKTWNDTTEEYDFSFTANSQPDNSLQSTNEGE